MLLYLIVFFGDVLLTVPSSLFSFLLTGCADQVEHILKRIVVLGTNILVGFSSEGDVLGTCRSQPWTMLLLLEKPQCN